MMLLVVVVMMLAIIYLLLCAICLLSITMQSNVLSTLTTPKAG